MGWGGLRLCVAPVKQKESILLGKAGVSYGELACYWVTLLRNASHLNSGDPGIWTDSFSD